MPRKAKPAKSTKKSTKKSVHRSTARATTQPVWTPPTPAVEEHVHTDDCLPLEEEEAGGELETATPDELEHESEEEMEQQAA